MKKLIISSLGVFLNLLLVFANPNMVVEYEFEGALVDRLNNSTLTAFNSTPSNNRNNIEQGFFHDDNGSYWYWKSNQNRGGGFGLT